jgi:hypothetical protein
LQAIIPFPQGEWADGMNPVSDSASKPVGKQSFIPSRSWAEKEENAQAAQAARVTQMGKAVKGEK